MFPPLTTVLSLWCYSFLIYHFSASKKRKSSESGKYLKTQINKLSYRSNSYTYCGNKHIWTLRENLFSKLNMSITLAHLFQGSRMWCRNTNKNCYRTLELKSTFFHNLFPLQAWNCFRGGNRDAEKLKNLTQVNCEVMSMLLLGEFQRSRWVTTGEWIWKC